VTEVFNYIAVDDRGNWSHHHGMTVMKYGSSLTSWQDYLAEISNLYGEAPTHLLFWDHSYMGTGRYSLRLMGGEEIDSGTRMIVHERPGNILELEFFA
jgi:hypothetical protein